MAIASSQILPADFSATAIPDPLSTASLLVFHFLITVSRALFFHIRPLLS
jgi:hypothetical protein